MIKWWVILISYIVAKTVYELSQSAKISKLNLQIQDMAKYFDNVQFLNNVQIKENALRCEQINHLQYQADMLKFCLLCPLYQEKVLKDAITVNIAPITATICDYNTK